MWVMLNKSNDVLFFFKFSPEANISWCESVSTTKERSSSWKRWRPTFRSLFLRGLRLFRWVRHTTVRPCPGGITRACGFIIAHLYRSERKAQFSHLALVFVNHKLVPTASFSHMTHRRSKNRKEYKRWPLRDPTINNTAEGSPAHV